MSGRRAAGIVAALALVAGVAAGLAAGGRPPDPDVLRARDAGALVLAGEAPRIYAGHLPPAGPASEAAGARRYRAAPAAAVGAAALAAVEEGTAWRWAAALAAAAAVAGIGCAVLAAAGPGTGAGTAAVAAAAAAIPLAPLLAAAAARGNGLPLLLALLAGSLLALARGRDRTAGILAGAAAALKVAPVALVLWFLWKGRRRAAAWGAGAALVLFLVPPLLAPGGGAALEAWRAKERLLVSEVDEPGGVNLSGPSETLEGQSLPVVSLRLLAGAPWLVLRDAPRPGEFRPGDPPPHRIVTLPAEPLSQRTALGVGLAACFVAFLAALFAGTPVPGEDPAAAAARLPLEGGLLLLAILFAWPEVRAAHYVLAAPVLAALAASVAAAADAPGPRAGLAVRAALAAAGAALLLLSGLAPAGDGGQGFLARGGPAWGGILVAAAAALTLSSLRPSPVPEEPPSPTP